MKSIYLSQLNNMEPLGGYFELEIPKGNEYHSQALRLNTGRNAIEYVLKHRGYKKGLVPFYCCDSVLEPFKKNNIPYEFYSLQENLLPALPEVDDDTCVLLINYFGLVGEPLKRLARSMKNVIFDNSQAFFEPPEPDIDTIYSPRKFFGVPDGAYLYTDIPMDESLEQDVSYQRCEHLLRRIDVSPEDGYPVYRENQNGLSMQPIKKMSKLTQRLLSSIDYDQAKAARERNFAYLHKCLEHSNFLSPIIQDAMICGPMVYPFFGKNDGLRESLIQNKIFVATYWAEVLQRVTSLDIEWILVNRIISLPVDQRYSPSHIDNIERFLDDGQ